MASIAIIQDKHRVLNEPNANGLTGFSKQMYEQFFEVLVEESGHTIFTADSLESYLQQHPTEVDVVICAPFPEIGNVAPGFIALSTIKDAFPTATIIVWSDRSEAAIEQSVLNDYGVAAYYTGNLIDAADDFADLIFKHS